MKGLKAIKILHTERYDTGQGYHRDLLFACNGRLFKLSYTVDTSYPRQSNGTLQVMSNGFQTLMVIDPYRYKSALTLTEANADRVKYKYTHYRQNNVVDWIDDGDMDRHAFATAQEVVKYIPKTYRGVSLE